MQNKKTIIVWDLFIRVFHWLLAFLILLAYHSEQLNDIHADLGYLILMLISLRIIWGFVGSKHAQFKNFPFSLRSLISYLAGVFRSKPVHYEGHNPATSWISLTMLLTLLVIIVSGVFILSTTEFEGYWVESLLWVGDDLSSVMSEVHEVATELFILQIVAHVVGVLIASFQHRKNFIKRMFKGH